MIRSVGLHIRVTTLHGTLNSNRTNRHCVIAITRHNCDFITPFSLRPTTRHYRPLIRPPQQRGLPIHHAQVVKHRPLISDLIARLTHRHFVALINPNNVNGAAITLQITRRLVKRCHSNVHLLSLTPVGSPRVVSTRLTSLLNLTLRSTRPVDSVTDILHRQRVLLIVSGYRRLLSTVTLLYRDVLHNTPRIRVLTADHRDLHTRNRCIRHLRSLSYPPPVTILSHTRTLDFSTLRLFIRQTVTGRSDFRLDSRRLPLTVRVYRHLSNVPLTVRLTTTRIISLNIDNLRARLRNDFHLLARNYRAALTQRRALHTALS